MPPMGANMVRCAVIALAWLLVACAGLPPPPRPSAAPTVDRCFEFYAALDHVVSEQGVTPSRPARIDGFPHLRVSRFLANYRDQPLSAEGEAAWLQRLAELDRESRQVEIASLPKAVAAGLTARYATGQDDLFAVVIECSEALQIVDLAHPERFALVRERARVPSDYQTIKRVFGIYPLTSLLVRNGVSRLHRETWQVFAEPLEALPVTGTLQRFQPPDDIGSTTDAARLFQDGLGVPRPTREQIAALFAVHAPVWEIDVARADVDLPGALRWHPDTVPGVDTAQAVVYRYPSYTHWQGDALLQLNYLIWFSARPPLKSFDILAGALDGLVWRVTLDHQGRPLLYDSVHPCGCYHQFFPSSVLALRAEALRLPEPPLVPQAAPATARGERLVLRVSASEHFIQRVYADKPSGTVYRWRPYEQLYSVPVDGGGQRSLFGSDGLVAGTERGERWLLWPMGIASPGAMRERGRHATAFVGRRHFDDADLLDRYFEPAPSWR